jgi:GntR family transcriptional regulator, N-acetylglucosamine utilization regulator
MSRRVDMSATVHETVSDDVETLGLTLDRHSYVPFYRQIRDQLETLIITGKLKPGRTIPSEGACAKSLGVSKMTVRQAFQALRSEGLLIIEKGKQPRVSTGRIQKDFHKLRGFTEEMARRGLKPSSKVLEFEQIVPDSPTANLLHLWHQEQVCRFRRLRYANKEVVGLETIILPARLFPGLSKQDLESQSLYALMENRYQISVEWSEEELEAMRAGKEEARLLQVAVGAPLFSMRRTVYDKNDIPVEHGHSLFRGDRYSASVISRRER